MTMELLLIGLVSYIAIQTIIIPLRVIRRETITLHVILYLVAIAAAFFIYTFVVAGSGRIVT